jgi:hypothetical protein
MAKTGIFLVIIFIFLQVIQFVDWLIRKRPLLAWTSGAGQWSGPADTSADSESGADMVQVISRFNNLKDCITSLELAEIGLVG